MTETTQEQVNPTEAEMRDSEAAHPQTVAELSACVVALTERPHDYGTCVYAMSLAAVAAFVSVDPLHDYPTLQVIR